MAKTYAYGNTYEIKFSKGRLAKQYFWTAPWGETFEIWFERDNESDWNGWWMVYSDDYTTAGDYSPRQTLSEIREGFAAMVHDNIYGSIYNEPEYYRQQYKKFQRRLALFAA